MKKNTKILIGVGIAAVAFLLYKKSKYIPKIPTKTTTTAAPVEGCPDGTTEVAVDCVQAPCPTQCVENPQEVTPIFLTMRTPKYKMGEEGVNEYFSNQSRWKAKIERLIKEGKMKNGGGIGTF